MLPRVCIERVSLTQTGSTPGFLATSEYSVEYSLVASFIENPPRRVMQHESVADRLE